MARVALILAVCVTILAGGCHAQDPASSWMAYAVAKTAHLGKRITFLNATWTVPSYPASRTDGSAPGWWWGIEPVPAVDLIQPILAWGDGFPQFTIFNGYFQWDDSDWYQSQSGTVTPGDKIYSYVRYTPGNDSYTMFIESGDFSVTTSIACEDGHLFSQAFFVIEHQPFACNELPTDGKVTFTDINIEVDGVPVAKPEWKAQQFQPACDSQAHVVSPSSISMTWNPNGQAGANAATRAIKSFADGRSEASF